MELKDSCRLCLAKEGEFYKLFNASNGDCTLAEELSCLLDFQIENSGDLPDSICANCYNINSFFKEFRRDCARVKDRLRRILEATDTQVSVKLEKTDDYEDDLEDRTLRIPIIGNPQHSNPSFVENLRSNFRDAIVSGVDRATNDVPSQPLETKSKKRRNEDSENTTDTLDKASIQEPMLALVKSEYLSDEEENEASHGQASDSENDSNQLNSYPDTLGMCDSRNNETLANSVSNPSNVSAAAATLGLNTRASLDNLYEGSSSPRRKRQRVMMEGNDSEERTRSSLIQEEIPHTVKEEEIEIFDRPDEDEFEQSEEDSEEKEDYSSDSVESSSSVDRDELEVSSSSSMSSDDSEEDTDMLLCLALLL